MRNEAFRSPLNERDELGDTLWVEVNEKPTARLAQHWLSAQIEQLEVELCALKWCRHGAVIQFVNDVPNAILGFKVAASVKTGNHRDNQPTSAHPLSSRLGAESSISARSR
jgi:hypothetical protein